MTAYDAGECTDSLVAGAGASAALTGLVFVAVSINVDPILRLQGLPERALATVLLLPSVVSRIGLIPGQSRAALAGELLGVGLLFAVVILPLQPGPRPVARDGGCRPSASGSWSGSNGPRRAWRGKPARRSRGRALLGGGRDRARHYARVANARVLLVEILR
jgi:hypothetical protein